MTVIVHRAELIRQSTIHLRPDQQSAANMLCLSLTHGGHQTFAAAIGAGKTVVLGAALKQYPGKVAIISRLDVLRDQTIHIFAKLGVGDHVAFYLARGRKLPDLSQFDLIVTTECMRDRLIDHPNILRIV